MCVDGVDRLFLTWRTHAVVRRYGPCGWGIQRAEEWGPFATLIWVIPSFKPAPQTPNLVLSFWCPQDLAQVTPPWRLFLITQSPSPCPSKNYSPSHSQNHTLILYCSQIYVNLLSTRLLAASQGQDYALDFGNASPTGFFTVCQMAGSSAQSQGWDQERQSCGTWGNAVLFPSEALGDIRGKQPSEVTVDKCGFLFRPRKVALYSGSHTREWIWDEPPGQLTQAEATHREMFSASHH